MAAFNCLERIREVADSCALPPKTRKLLALWSAWTHTRELNADITGVRQAQGPARRGDPVTVGKDFAVVVILHEASSGGYNGCFALP